MFLGVNTSVSDPNKSLVHVEHWWHPYSGLSWSSIQGEQRFSNAPPQDSVIEQTPGPSGLPYQSQAVTLKPRADCH